MEVHLDEGTHEKTSGMAPSYDVDLDKVPFTGQEDIYRTLVECLRTEDEPLSMPRGRSDVKTVTVSSKRRNYKYYSEDTTAVVEGHFTRSLLSLMDMNSQMNETRSSFKTAGRQKRKSRRKIATKTTPFHVPVSNPVQNGPYERVFTAPIPPPLQVVRVEPPCAPIPYDQLYQMSRSLPAGKPAAYTAFSNGNTLIEVYCPTVGRGFNPRYNSLLVEPTIESYLPLLAGQSSSQSPTQADVHAFQQMAIDFHIPEQQ